MTSLIKGFSSGFILVILIALLIVFIEDETKEGEKEKVLGDLPAYMYQGDDALVDTPNLEHIQDGTSTTIIEVDIDWMNINPVCSRENYQIFKSDGVYYLKQLDIDFISDITTASEEEMEKVINDFIQKMRKKYTVKYLKDL